MITANQTKTGTGNAKSNNNTAAADSSAEDDSDDEEEQKEAHDEVSQFISFKWNNKFFTYLPNLLLANGIIFSTRFGTIVERLKRLFYSDMRHLKVATQSFQSHNLNARAKVNMT